MKVPTTKSIAHLDDKVEIAIEQDSHTDPPIVKKVAKVLERTRRMVLVSVFTDRLGKTIQVEVVKVVVNYECERTGLIYLLILCNRLNVLNMESYLIHPVLIRLNGIKVDKYPKVLSKFPNETNYSIFMEDMNLQIPLRLDEVISYLPYRPPAKDELMNNDGCSTLPPNISIWEPCGNDFDIQEDRVPKLSNYM